MDPKLKAILQKAKAIDKAATKYDTNPTTTTNTKTNGLYEQMGETQVMEKPKISIDSPQYKEQIKKSKLPPEIQKAMMDNPIPQPSMVNEFNESDIKDINPNYDDEMGFDFMTEQRHTPKNLKQDAATINPNILRKMIAEEIAKALPSIVEKYFDKKMIQENISLLRKIKTVKKK